MVFREFAANHPLALKWHYAQFKYNFVEERFGWVDRLRLKNKNFSILSNNCVPGYVYHRFHLEYNTPTVWNFIFPDEFIRFLKNYRWYLQQPLKFRDVSQHKCTLEDKSECTLNKIHGGYPIGVLGDDVEIHFLHYRTAEQALDKWIKRVQRVNYDNLFFVLSDCNEFKEEYLQEFDMLPSQHKIFISNKPRKDCRYGIWVKEIGSEKYAATFQRYIDAVKWLNGEKTFLRS